ncbi:MAG: PorV/PorQ family protein [Endomicrobia bacterium]|nr:PorV/PorQ family protein [Endomicrobiia bacterium]MCL2799497.1 PorV/PorQ family protein [Endomicrobiia bacterium]
MNKNAAVLLLLFMPSLCFAAFSDSGLGTSGAAFLKLGAGARAAAMGGAFTSAQDYSSDGIYWNPAKLAYNTKKDLTLMYSSYFEDISYGWTAFSMPTGYGVFGAAVQYLSYGNIMGRDTDGFETSDFSPYDLAVYLSYARGHKFDDSSNLGYGVNLKYVYSKIENSASAFAFDAGAVYTLKDNLTSFGAVLQNMGTTLKYNEESESLPLMFKIGASRIIYEDFLVSWDIIFPSDNNIFLALGGEYKIQAAEETDIFLRAGYDGKSKDVPGFSGFNAGFGVKYLDYVFDYAFSPYGDLGSVHRVSIGLKFGNNYDDATVKEKKQKKHETKKDKPSNYARPVETRKTEPKKQEVNAKKNYNVAVLNFISKSIPKSERDAYSSMLRKALADSDNLFSIDKRFVEDVYNENAMPSNFEISSILKKTKADKLIVCTVAKNEGNLNFNIYVYDDASNMKKYNVISKDSFADAQRKLKEFVNNLSGD